jgi:soluble lytic murein transglycosylase-like protein
VIRTLPVGLISAALVAAGCWHGSSPPRAPGLDRRLVLLEEALDNRHHDPARAVQLLIEAGPGPELERVRLEAMVSSLESIEGSVDDWRAALSTPLPDDLEARAVIGLADSLVTANRLDEAVSVLESADDHARGRADVALLAIGEGPWRERAARRLSVAAPHRLRRSAPELEGGATADLDAAERLARAAAWSDAGSPARAASELRRLRLQGADERSRVLRMARYEIESGNPGRALSALRALPSSDPEAQVLRGQSARQQGWQRFPRAGSRSSFRSCFRFGSAALGLDPANPDTRRAALMLVVECATEIGLTEDAVAAWWQLEGLEWTSDRRSWLGRRLGVALASSGGDRRQLLRLASAIPAHSRCLGFWAAVGTDRPRAELERLAETGIPDLYAQWASDIVGRPRPRSLELPPAVVPSAPPASVAWLLDRDAIDEAAAEWRRIRARRGTWPADGLAEAELAERRERQMDVIRALRAAVPELGTVDMVRAPSNAVHAYLPIRWIGALRSAAAESGVDPWLLAGVARQESAFVAHARSPRSAKGVMQLLEGTASGHARALGLGRRPDLYDPEVNFRLGARELKRLLDRFGALEPALAAYNAGETRARRWWKDQPDRYRFTEAVPIPETYNYIRRVAFLAEAYRLVYREQWENR